MMLRMVMMMSMNMMMMMMMMKTGTWAKLMFSCDVGRESEARTGNVILQATSRMVTS